jgi:hypothetical protein
METFSTRLSNAETERLAIALEEISEAGQIIGKVLRHGYESTHPDGGPTNRELLECEIGHVQYILESMCDRGDLKPSHITRSRNAKALSILPYLHFQEGTDF